MTRPIKLPSGRYRIRWFDETGKRQSAVYPTESDAASALRRKQVETEDIRLGIRRPTVGGKTFSHLCDHWLTHRTSQKRHQDADRSIIRRHLLPDLGPKPVQSIGTEAASLLRLNLQRLSSKTVNNVLTLLISMLNHAKDIGWVTEVPRIRKPRIEIADKDFRYLRNQGEIDQFLRSAKLEGQLIYTLYATAIYTGLRAGELAHLKWRNILWDRRMIRIEGSFGGPTKSGTTRYIPLFDVIRPLLEQWRLQCPTEVVFPSQSGAMLGKSARAFQEILHRVLRNANFPNVDTSSGPKRYIVFHDLRHTFASHWVMQGKDIFKLQKILGHKSMQMTMRYAHLAPDAFAGDLDAFGPPILSETHLRSSVSRLFETTNNTETTETDPVFQEARRH